MATKHFHLSINLTEYGRHSGAWRHPDADVSTIPNLDAYVHAARWAEKGCFDQAFMADMPNHVWGDAATTGTRLDAMDLAAYLAEVTDRIGLIATISTSYNQPYDVARRGAALDHVTGGRLGLNYVASSGDDVARNFNQAAQRTRAERYARYSEFLEVVTRLWDAAPRPGVAGEVVRYRGTYFDIDAMLDVYRPAMGRPLIIQAGQSAEGRDLAARWADAVYAAGTTLEHGQRYYADIKARTVAYGRDPDSIKVIMGIAPFIGETEVEAIELKHLLDEYHAEGADTVGYLSRILEHDLSGYDPDAPLPYDDLPEVKSSSVGMATMFVRIAREEQLSLGEIAYRAYVGGLANMQFVSVGSPVQVADTMQEWFENHACDGYSLVAPNIGPTIENFVTHVVPILQERGLVRSEYDASTLAGHFGLTELDPRYTPLSGRPIPLPA